MVLETVGLRPISALVNGTASYPNNLESDSGHKFDGATYAFSSHTNVTAATDIGNRTLHFNVTQPNTTENATIFQEDSTYGNISTTVIFSTADLPAKWAVITGVTVGLVVAVLGLIGNAMTIAAYRRNRKLRTSFNFLITNLCAVDLLFSAVVIPTHLPMMITRSSLYSVHWCSAVGYLHYSFLSSSVINLVCIAINRYVGIVHSKRYRQLFSKEFAKWWLIGIWISSPILYFPLLITHSIEWRPSSLRCALSSSRHEATSIRCYQIALNIALEAVPTVALALFYRAILQKVKKCRKTVEHYPVTNSPSVATSCMLAGGVGRMGHCHHSCCADGAASPKGKDRHSGKSRALAKDNDVTEGKKAIIMAYLQVPSTTISPRKNSLSLYKRSPPQTRTMIVTEPAGEGNRSQVFISGTTSSPNLLKGKIESGGMAVSAGRCSPTRWGRQRSFSQGDEEIEPECGMIGDTGSDLPHIESLTLHLSGSDSSPDIEASAGQQEVASPDYVFSISDEDFEDSAKRKDCSKIPRESKENKLESPSQNGVLVTKNSIDKPKKQHSNDDIRDAKFSLHIDTPECRNGCVKIEPRKEETARSSKRKRMLTRQRTIDDEGDCRKLTPEMPQIASNSSKSLLSVPLPAELDQENQLGQSRSCRSFSAAAWHGQLSPPPCRVSAVMGLPVVKPARSAPGGGASILNELKEPSPVGLTAPSSDANSPIRAAAATGNSKRARYVAKATSSSSDRCTSQGTEVTYLTTENVPQKQDTIPEYGPETKEEKANTPNDTAETEVAKRVMLRRGASDIGGIRWLKRFRKSRNWSMSSTNKQSRYRVRGAAGMRKETIIKIVIENATEEFGDSDPEYEPEYSPSLYDIASEQGSLATDEGNGQSSPTRYDDRKCGNQAVEPGSEEDNNNFSQYCRYLWKKLMNKYRNTTKAGEGNAQLHTCSCDCSNQDGELDCEACAWEEEDDSCDGCSKSDHMRSVGLMPRPWEVASDSPKARHSKPIVMLPIPQLTIDKDASASRRKSRESDEQPPLEGSSDNNENTKRNIFATGALQKRLSSGGDSAGTGSHDTDIISSRENEMLLQKRRRMNDSSQCLRASNLTLNPTNFPDDDRVSVCDVNLGRRWSGQSDAISIYSGRYLMSSNPGVGVHGSNSQRGSISAMSGISQGKTRKQSKKSEGSAGSGKSLQRNRRKSIYQRWASKKSSIVSSLGSNSSRRRRRDAERRLAYSGLAICVAFAFCVLPTSVVGVLLSTTAVQVPPSIRFGVAVLSWLHAVVNPILYGFLNSQYRQEYRHMLRDVWKRVSCKKDDRTGFGRGSSKSAIVKRMRQQYESEDNAHSAKNICDCLCRRR